MGVFSLGHRFPNATAGVADEFVCNFWNPSSTHRIWVNEISLFRRGTTGTRATLVRTTTRGTPGASVATTADNAWEPGEAPPSGVVLDYAAFTVMPTAATPGLMGIIVHGVTGSTGSGWTWIFPGRGILVPPGTGLGVSHPLAIVWVVSDFNVVWTEG